MMSKMLETWRHLKPLIVLMVWRIIAEIHGDKQMNVMLNELMVKVEKRKLQNIRQTTIHRYLEK